jgi:uncharacterized protein
MSSSYKPLFEEIQTIEVIDTHEHLASSEAQRPEFCDVLTEFVRQYFTEDLLSAGMSSADLSLVIGPEKSVEEKWEILAPYWEFTQDTGYARAISITIRDLYGIDELSKETVGPLNDAWKKTFDGKHYHRVLKEKSKIKMSILDSDLFCDREFFRSVYRLDHFIFPMMGSQIEDVENFTGIQICRFQDWLDACEASLDKALEQGAIGLKTALAYLRPLKFEDATMAEAEADFNSMMTRRHFPPWVPEVFSVGTKFQDFMMHYVLWLANKRGLTVQVHTGIQAQNGNHIKSADPRLLSNLFERYRDVRFDLFHIGYPYHIQMAVLAKNFPNVYLDMCWGHIVSPQASIEALHEWLNVVPLNKISAFGGDYTIIDTVYGHQYMAREHVAKVLAHRVDERLITMERAMKIARWLFHDNPAKLFPKMGIKPQY